MRRCTNCSGGYRNKLMWRTKRQFQHDIQSMFSLVDNIIAERKSSGDQEENDLLSVC